MFKKILILFFSVFLFSCQSVEKNFLSKNEKINFQKFLPKNLGDYSQKEIKNLNKNTVQAIYQNIYVMGVYPEIKINKSKEKTKSEIGFENYQKLNKNINGINVTMFCKNDYVKSAFWYKNNFFYSFETNNKGIYVNDEKLIDIIMSIN